LTFLPGREAIKVSGKHSVLCVLEKNICVLR